MPSLSFVHKLIIINKVNTVINYKISLSFCNILLIFIKFLDIFYLNTYFSIIFQGFMYNILKSCK